MYSCLSAVHRVLVTTTKLTYPKIIPRFHAAGITLHAWIFPDFTTQDVTKIAAMGVDIHLDLNLDTIQVQSN